MAVQPTPSGSTDPVVEAELDRLTVKPIAQLRVHYRELFRTDPPQSFGPDLLRRSIAHRIQEKAYGGLSRETQRMLDHFIKAFAARPDGRIVLPRRIKAGSILVRQWNGRSHRVMVLEKGFAWDGQTYTNLSEIAGQITGTKWNGPRFFGLRSKAGEVATLPKDGSAADRGPPLDPARMRRRHFGGGSDYRKHKAVARRSAADGAGDGR